MGTISSGTGLISGMDIASIVDQLMEIEAGSRNILANRQAEVNAQRTAVMDISSTLMSLKMTATALRTGNQLALAQASSSNTDILTATASAGALPATNQLRVARLVSTQQTLSNGFADAATPYFTAGTMTIQSAKARLTDDVRLEVLNAQDGVRRGSIRITDRSGTAANVDLTTAAAIGDVLNAINDADVDVLATVSGGQIILTDQTGQTASNLIVSEVGVGHAATDLGILGSVAADALTGTDIVTVDADTQLGALNNQMGVRSVLGQDDLRIALRDGTTFDVNLDGATTLEGVLDAINNDAGNPGTLVASLDTSADAIRLTDTSVGGNTLTVTALNSSMAAHDLGILTSDGDADGIITGSALVADLQSILLTRLNGGDGVDRGQISITDRNGVNSVVDLSGADTVQDLLDAINDAGVAAEVTASLNTSGNGIVVTDTSGGSGNFVIADVGGTTMAADLGITVNDTVGDVASGDLNRAFVNENTCLDSMRGGLGVNAGKFQITNSLGVSAEVDLTQGNEVTLQDVIDEINAKGLGVTARINDTGDGLILEDTNGGPELLTVADTSGTAAADLSIAGTAATGTTYIDGSTETTVDVEVTDTLTTLAAKINASGAPVQAGILNDGSDVSPYRLSLVAEQSGAGGALLVDAAGTGIALSEMVSGRDAVLVIGDGAQSDPMLITSRSNTVTGLVEDVTLDLVGADPAETVTVTVTPNTTAVAAAMNNLIVDYNTVMSTIDTYTAFDSETMTAAVLQGDITLINTQRRLSQLVLSQFTGTGSSYSMLAAIGITRSDGELTLDEDLFRAAFEENPEDVRDLLLDTENGVLTAFNTLMSQLTETGTGSLSVQATRLEQQSQMYQNSIDAMDERLELKRERLTNQFIAMERALAALQTQQSALESLVALAESWSNALGS